MWPGVSYVYDSSTKMKITEGRFYGQPVRPFYLMLLPPFLSLHSAGYYQDRVECFFSRKNTNTRVVCATETHPIKKSISSNRNLNCFAITYKNSDVLKSTQIPLPPLKFYMATSFYLSFFSNIWVLSP